MKSTAHVAVPPQKPLMIYDGDCHFCSMWIRRWQQITGDLVDYLPFQDGQVGTRFPEIPREQFESSVQFIQPDGSTFDGAEAVFRSLAVNAHDRWLVELYEHSPVFAKCAESSYRFIARHRTFFSVTTRVLWGRHVERPDYRLVRWTFLRSLGVIYLVAFVSLWVQIGGLLGSQGILPVQSTMDRAHQVVTTMNIGVDRYHLIPTLCWFGSSDGFLKFQCAAGTALAVLLIIGIAPAPCLFLLWLIYLSLTTVGDVFLSYQWDCLLLETGLLAIFFAPLQLLPRRPDLEAPPSRLSLWLLRWLVFRLMFESGCAKWLSHDSTWRNLTALRFHYWTQPLPTWIAWYAHQMPLWIQKSDVVVMFAIELGVPFLIFLPRRPRQFACLSFIALQLFILLTGNYGFFNLLTIVLCLTLLDDGALRRCAPEWCRAPFRKRPQALPTRSRAWSVYVIVPLAVLVACSSLVQFFELARVRLPGPGPVIAVVEWLAPLRSFNRYGLFAVMTTSRSEIVVEGSDDGVQWHAYEFKDKPGDLRRRPRFVAPHQPRLDWQMWFAALGDVRENPWFGAFCFRLLQGSPAVLRLMEHNPFPDKPPRYIRAVLYDYHFTDRQERRATGNWWRREQVGLYLPPVSIAHSPVASNNRAAPQP